MPPTEAQVLDALRVVQDPDLHRDIVALGFVRNILIEGNAVSLDIELTTPACPVKDELQAQAHHAIQQLGFEQININMTARVMNRKQAEEDLLPNVRQIVAIASGKGGVGKSTVTINLALALARQGAKVGVMDADVYGPSIPMMMGCAAERPFTRDQKIIPIERFGIKMMSMGFLLEDNQAVLWRGPMVAGTVRQLLSDVTWGDLDYLLVDLPPGTGDAPMTLAQQVPLSGVVIVTTPHNVAANIAGKAAGLFRRLNAPVIGVVENMASFICPHCGEETRVFAGTPGEELAQTLGTSFLGSIPLDPKVGEAGDKGVPSLIAHPERPQATAFAEIAGKLAQQVSIMAMARSVAQPGEVSHV